MGKANGGRKCWEWKKEGMMIKPNQNGSLSRTIKKAAGCGCAVNSGSLYLQFLRDKCYTSRVMAALEGGRKQQILTSVNLLM
jgi:hypothetical protein